MKRLKLPVAMCMVLLVIMVVGAGCGGAQKPAEKTKVALFCYAGYNQAVVAKEVVQEYMKAHPNVEIEVIESSNALMYPKMVAAKKVSPDKPIINFGFFNADASAKGDMDDMWLPLNPERIPNMRDLREGSVRAGNKGAAISFGFMGIVYNKDIIKDNPPTSWTDIWANPRYKGRVCLWDYIFPTSLIPAARLNGGGEKNIDPGFKVWSENYEMIGSLETGNEGIKNALLSGKAWIHPDSHSQAYVWGVKEGGPFAYVIPKEGQIAWPIYLQIVKGSTPEQVAVAEDIINELLSPKANGRHATLICSLPSNAKAELGPELRDEPALQPDAFAKAWALDWDTIARENDNWRARWDREIKAKLMR